MKAYCVVLCLFAVIGLSHLSTGQTRLITDYGNLSLGFEPNQGQTDPRVKFLARGNGYTVFLTDSEAVLSLPTSRQSLEATRVSPVESRQGLGSVVRMKLLGANRNARISGANVLPGKSNYFIGNDPTKWRRNVATYAKVEYQSIYPGVDLVYYGNQRQLENDFIVAPGAKPTDIRMSFQSTAKIKTDGKTGDLLLLTNGTEVRLRKPVIYQLSARPQFRATTVASSGAEVQTDREYVSGRYMLEGNTVRFAVAAYDTRRALIIDPVLVYSTYLGGTGNDSAGASNDGGNPIAVDALGNTYITGTTVSTDFPTAGALQPSLRQGEDVFVTKINANGSALVYSTYLGGSKDDSGSGIAVDSSGSVYVIGITNSADFPTVNPFQATFGGGSTCINNGFVCFGDAFVAKLSPSGSNLVYSTYLGGSETDIGVAIAVDAGGSAYVTGGTFSSDFPTVNPLQLTNHGGQDAFIAKLNASGSALTYSTYLGGSAGVTLGNPNATDEFGASIALDAAGNAYIAGRTPSPDFPTTAGAFQTTCHGCSPGVTAFVSKLNASGSGLVYSTFLGGSSLEGANGIAVDSSGNAYVTGETGSSDFPTANALQPNYHGAGDVFITKLDSSGSGLIYSTYLGGSGEDDGLAISVDNSGNAYIAGFTSSSDFPVINPIQSSNRGPNDALVLKLNAAGSALVYSTYLGGTADDKGRGITVDSSGNAYVTGFTCSQTDFPTVHPIQSSDPGGCDAFVSKIGSLASTTTSIISSVNPSTAGQSVTFTATVVALGNGSPTGTVTFADGASILGIVVVGSGQAIFGTSTLAVGTHQIRAAYGGDNAFAPSSGSLTQNVEYGICALYDQTRSVHSGATFPIKIEICDANGKDLSSSSIAVHATQVTSVSGFSGPVDDAGNANPDDNFRFDNTLGTTGGYIFNLKTTGLGPGTYSLQFTVTGDPVIHSVNFGVK
jgi:hypothetical protein